MRTLFTLAAVGCLMLSLGKSAQAQSEIPWLTDWRQARDVAQKQHRLVLLHFWSETCAPCQRLEHNVFNRVEVVRALHSGYIPVKVNVDHDSRLAKHYGVTSWPTDVIVDPSGKVLHRQTSPPEPHQYVAFLDSIKTHHAVAMLTSQKTNTQQGQTPPPSSQALESSGPQGKQPPSSTQTRSSSFVPPNRPASNPNSFAAIQPKNPLTSSISSKPAPTGKPYANPFLAAPANNSQPPTANSAAAGLPSGGSPTLEGSTASSTPAPSNANRWTPPASATIPNFAANAAGPGNNPNAYNMPNQYPDNPAPPTSNWQGNQLATRQAMIPNAPQRPPLPTSSETFGLESYCPVTLIEGNIWSRGDRRWGAVHRGRTYLFSKPEHQQRFLANPDAYAPVLSGYDPVQYVDAGVVVEGKRRHGLYYGSKYFLFSDEATLQKFQTNPNRYIPNEIMR